LTLLQRSGSIGIEIDNCRNSLFLMELRTVNFPTYPVRGAIMEKRFS